MADLRLPYPSGPRMDDTVFEGRRKIAENLDAIADWLRLLGELISPAECEVIKVGLREGAIAIDRLEDAIR